MTCPFCDHSHSFLESSLSLARLDKYPASPGHTLITTKRHISSYFEATPDEVSGLWQLVGEGLRPVVSQVFPLEQVRDAHLSIENQENIGRVVLSVWDGAAP